MNETASPSTRPYLLRALHEWCSDNGLTPYLVVQVDKTVQVPAAFVQDGQIVLNASYGATSGLQMGNDYITFKARFGGKPHDIMLPVQQVLAIYARETGQGMSFPPEPELMPNDAAFEDDEDGGGDLLLEDDASIRDISPAKTKPVVQLVSSSVEGVDDDDDDDGGPEQEPPQPPSTPPTGGGKRPALKRVK